VRNSEDPLVGFFFLDWVSYVARNSEDPLVDFFIGSRTWVSRVKRFIGPFLIRK
jgi:hypothetical protein